MDAARQSLQQSSKGTENLSDNLKPKLTLDLSYKNLDRIPLEVVAIIRRDLERYGSLVWTPETFFGVSFGGSHHKDLVLIESAADLSYPIMRCIIL